MNFLRVLIVMFLTVTSVKAQVIKLDTPEQQYRAMILKSRSDFGKLNSIQEKIFQEEVLRNADFFIKNLNQEKGRYFGDVDVSSIRDYLEFPSQAEAEVLYLIDSQCEKCKATTDEVKKTFQTYWGRRLLSDSKILEPGGLKLKTQIRIRNKPHEPDETDYDDVGFQVLIKHDWNGLSSTQTMILNADTPILPSFSRVFLSSILDLGSKIRSTKKAERLESITALLVHVSPLREFSVYDKINQGIRVQFENSQPHRLARGAGIFLVKGVSDPETLIQYLRTSPNLGVKIRSVRLDPENPNRIEVKLE